MSLLLIQAANYILPLIILPYLMRILGIEKFGVVMFAQSFAVFFNIIVDFGFTISATREISIVRDDKKERSKIFISVFIIKLLLIFVSFLLLFIIINLFSRFSEYSIIYYLSFGVVIGQALFPVWFFQGIEKMKYVTFVNVAAKIIFTALVFLLITKEEDFIYVPLFNSLGYIMAGAIGLFISFKHITFLIPKQQEIASIFKESFSLFVSNFSSSLVSSCNTFILGVFTNDTLAGVFSSFEKLILAVKNVFLPIYQALFPWVAKQGFETKKAVLKKTAPIVLCIGVLISFFIWIFGTEALNIIYDNEEVTSYNLLFKFLGLIAIFSSISMLLLVMYFPAIKQYNLRMKIFIIAGIINVSLSCILVYYYNIYGITISVVFTEFILLLLSLYYYKKTT